MSEQIEDPSGEVLERSSRLALAAALEVARRIADNLREQAAQREAAEMAEAARLQDRWNAEQAGARAQLQVANDAWLQRATPEEAAEAWSTARAWSEVDPSFVDDEQRLRDGIRQRWGVDVDTSGEAGLRAEADVERAKARSEERAQTADEMTAGGILAGTADEVAALENAEQHRSAAAAHDAAAASLDASADDVAYDSDARRQALADRATAAGVDGKTVDGRVRAASANAQPVKTATRKRQGVSQVPQRWHVSERIKSEQLGR